MANSSQTQFAILGLLQLGPMSGYDLKRTVDESISHFWREGWGRIYPTLQGLEMAGLVAKRTERRKTGQKQGRERKCVFASASREKGAADVAQPRLDAGDPPQRSAVEGILWAQCRAGVTRRHVERFRERCVADIATYEAVLRAIDEEHARHPDAPFWKMTVSYGLAHQPFAKAVGGGDAGGAGCNAAK